MDDYKAWRGRCGTQGWYDIPDNYTEKFLTEFMMDVAKLAAEAYSQREEQP
jgi:hypothetical protein